MTTSAKFIDIERRDGVAWFRFNRPPVNAIDRAMLDEIVTTFGALTEDPAVRVIVIASVLDNHFSTGADITAFRDTDVSAMRAWIEQTHMLARLIRGAPQPILAAISGIAVGGGLEMTFHADLRFAATTARLGQPEINIAFIPPVGGTQGLVRLVGRSNAFKILYGGKLVDATTAHGMGLVDFLVAPKALTDEVDAYARILAEKPANALAAIRRCLVDGGADTFEGGLAIEFDQACALAAHPNFREGIEAFLGKRKPEWRQES